MKFTLVQWCKVDYQVLVLIGFAIRKLFMEH